MDIFRKKRRSPARLIGLKIQFNRPLGDRVHPGPALILGRHAPHLHQGSLPIPSYLDSVEIRRSHHRHR